MKYNELLRFLFHRQLLIPIIFFVGLELFFRMGYYKPLLKKNSYAANTNNITGHALSKREVLDPDVLLIGTSVAFEGVSLRILNEEFAKKNLKVQTLALRGSELVVQYALLDKFLPEFSKVKTIIHILEPGIPWVDKKDLAEPTLAMLSEIDPIKAFSYIHLFDYNVTFENRLFLGLKMVAYRKDVADFLTTPTERIKSLSRKKEIETPWYYENPQLESIEGYKLKSLNQCVSDLVNQPEFIAPNSNPDHRRMLIETCQVSFSIPKETGKTEATERYFKKLRLNYGIILGKGIKIIHVFAPYSHLLREYSPKERMTVWREGLEYSLDGRQKLDAIDLQDSLGVEDNGQYCFDMIHLNKLGMEKFSKILAENLLPKINSQ